MERKEGPFDPEIRTPGRHAKRRQKEREMDGGERSKGMMVVRK